MLHTLIGVVMLVILAIMFLSIILPAFFVKPDRSIQNQYVLAIDSGHAEHQQTLLNYLELLLKRDLLVKPHIAVVILDKGLTIILNKAGQNLMRINKLQNAGVEFYICGRSLRKLCERQPQVASEFDGFKVVENGAAYINRLMDEGYINDFA